MVIWKVRPSLSLGDNGNHDLLQLFPARDRPGGEVGGTVVVNVDNLFALDNEYRL